MEWGIAVINTKAFKAYDIRGIYPEEVNEELAYRVGKVFCALFGAESVVVGCDIRLTGPKLLQALCDGVRYGNDIFCYCVPECGWRYHGYCQP